MSTTRMNFELGHDIDAMRATVQGFAQKCIAPRAEEECSRSNSFPIDFGRNSVSSACSE